MKRCTMANPADTVDRCVLEQDHVGPHVSAASVSAKASEVARLMDLMRRWDWQAHGEPEERT